MALKSKITTKAEFDALPDVIKAEYAEENGVWLLQSDDATELRSAKDREKIRADNAEAEARRLRDEKAASDAAVAEATRLAEEAKARKAGDVAALEASWQAKFDAAIGGEKARGDKLEKSLRDLLVDREALVIAAEISTVPELMEPIIRARLQADLDGERPFTRVLDTNGKPSAANIDDLKKELVANAKFASIIKASNASGGGTTGNNSGGGAPAKKISEMSEAERVALHRANPVAYKQQAAAEGIQIAG